MPLAQAELSSPAVSRLDVQPFADEHLEEAATLLAERHRHHRATEPLLPPRYEDASAAGEEVEALWRSEAASGAIAVRGGRAVGYVLGIAKSDAVWGPNVWVDYAGHAVEQAEDVRDLYAAAAARWVDDGRTRHYVQVPATDAELVDAWFRVSFGAQQADGLCEIAAVSTVPSTGVSVRVPSPDEVDVATRIGPSLHEHQALSPVFSMREAAPEERFLQWWSEDLANPKIGTFVADADGRTVGLFQVCSVELSDDHAGLARPDNATYLAYAATLPEARGAGVGIALTSVVFAWAGERGYVTMVTDWRVTNLLSSRFWPRRGFRTAFLRLYRSIP
ncbi:MAG: GNAT family N-acetyltransferase [Thermoleophilia bacterium]|nr:GNAT family N-acetyltransferase [Thermoleophilia bacterium]